MKNNLGYMIAGMALGGLIAGSGMYYMDHQNEIDKSLKKAVNKSKDMIEKNLK